MIRAFLISVIILFALISFAQVEAKHWYFGENAGLVFSNGLVYENTSGKLISDAGCCAISNSSTGELLWYSNGKMIWNRNNEIMQGASNLSGLIVFNQNSIFIPSPINTDLYFILTISSSSDTTSSGLYFSIIDKSLNNGNGSLILKNHKLLKIVAEKISAVNHCNGIDHWFTCFSKEDNSFRTFLVDNDTLPTDSIIHESEIKINNDLGCIKYSPSGLYFLAPVNSGNILAALYDFNNRTGELNNIRYLYRSNLSYTYGVDFSADGRFLYISTGGESYEILQYDLLVDTEEEINKSRVQIATGNNYALQLGLDEKIYVAKVNEAELAVINFPGEKGIKCDFDFHGFALSNGISKMGLPNFNQSYFFKPKFYVEGTCLGDTTHFSIMHADKYESIEWYFKDITGNYSIFSTESEPDYLFSVAGEYSIKLILENCNNKEIVNQVIHIYEKRSINILTDGTFCDKDKITLSLDTTYDSIIWNRNYSANEYVVNNPGNYEVQAYNGGCQNNSSINLNYCEEYLFVPTAFTPDNDGINDIFAVKSNADFLEYEMLIFNRRGNVVFHSNELYSGWDGYNNGNSCPSGVYSYRINYLVNNNVEQFIIKRGTFLLIK